MSDIANTITESTATQPQFNVKGRREEVMEWDEERQRERAAEEGIELTGKHFAVLEFLRENYVNNGVPSRGRDLTLALEEEFAAQGAGAYLYSLFPRGPVIQGSRIAGVPVPPHSEDPSFGSVM